MSFRDASRLDLISAIMDAPERPLDFAFIAKLKAPISRADLRKGADSARHAYALTGSLLSERRWVWTPELETSIESITTSDEARNDAILGDLERGFELGSELPLRQLVVETPSANYLVLVCHHAAADIVSSAMWLSHQLEVSSGRKEACMTPSYGEPVLRTHDQPVRKSKFSRRGPSTPLWSRSGPPSRRRKLHTFDLDAAPLRSGVENQPFTYNDLLCAVALAVFHAWNESHGAPTDRIALWCPVNIRKSPFEGFGNGSSRVRLYPRLPPTAPIGERCAELRAQLEWSKKHGEWNVPESPLLKLPDPWMSRIVRAYLDRPWVDMASGLFSHAERLTPKSEFTDVTSVEVVAELHRLYPFGFVGTSHGARTQVTLTWDPAMLDDGDVSQLIELCESELRRAAGALA